MDALDHDVDPLLEERQPAGTVLNQEQRPVTLGDDLVAQPHTDPAAGRLNERRWRLEAVVTRVEVQSLLKSGRSARTTAFVGEDGLQRRANIS